MRRWQWAACIGFAVSLLLAIGLAGLFEQVFRPSARASAGAVRRVAAKPVALESNARLPENLILPQCRTFRAWPLSEFTVSNERRAKYLSLITRWVAAKHYLAAYVHLLRLYRHIELLGDEKLFRSYQELLRFLTDDRQYRKLGGRESILIDTVHGAAYPRVSTSGGREVECTPHVDKVLSVLAELGFPLDFQVVTSSGRAHPLRDVLVDSLCRSQPQREPYWSLIAYAHYLRGGVPWITARGEQMTIDSLAARVAAEPALDAPCLGTHRLYSLAKLWARSQEEPDFLRSDVVAQVDKSLLAAVRLLEHNQLPDGSWNENWAGTDNVPPDLVAHNDVARNANCFLATTHMLEWFSVVPPSHRPRPETIGRALKFVLAELDHDSQECFAKSLLPASHGVRAVLNLSE